MFLALNQQWTLLVVVAVQTTSISIGMGQGFSAVLLPQLENSSFNVDSETSSWIASLGVISTPIGALASGLLAEVIGRKWTIESTGIPFLLGWILMAVAQSQLWLYAGRFITGFAIGMAAACYVYLAEISRPDERGLMAALGPVCVSLGVLMVYSMGYFMDWHLSSVVCAAMAAFSMFIIYFLPESPPYLASKGKYHKAQDVLTFLRGSADEAEKEMTQVLQSVNKTKKLTWQEYMGQVKDPAVWKPFIILIVFFLCQEGSGMYVIVYYATDLFQNVGPVLDSSVESIIVGVVRLVVSIIGAACIQRFGRRTLAMFASIGMGLSMAGASGYTYAYGDVAQDDRPYNYFPFVCLVFHVIMSMMGMLQLPWLMMGELFPLKVRGLMSGIVSSLAYLFIFAIVKIYPNLMAWFQLWGMLALFSGVSVFTLVFVYFFLPETQGFSLIEIENNFRKGSKAEAVEPDPVYILRV
ncbi:Sugar (and other) transporter [Nesidiocoris tenuis]|uniref:Sugar (And other) transporter n=2 Tax=Nesidiocoris tenuis TaxID=355587 RepID=A0ABN7AKH5_9HEMI|nr:Sugar (and other) transporter [Nesidiocoris tenuis]